ncbi:Ferric iron ABC transporter, iron-binding protein [Methylophaga frappieri]|uniref:Ferric iron ABC transporter, iron-binding protein n=1 Tax=Methylophaga frappieri (strain ATCC BAA-2434 / DSM 25690 / JAM7) TaxID=754477 RepID=I1YHT6_METFJ|nr:Fe(3+) ABC transporter substrate-binding protein [Methylophaga frappieri]AFJ02479.1 Ferric iron ABC transporter, iron-binding protein [Methylophaga frappieri]
MRPTRLLACLGLSLSLAFPVAASAAEEVNLYSARIESLIKPILDRFTEQTGINVNLVTGNADQLISRLKTEGRNSPADMLITTDAGRLHRAKEAGVVQPVSSDILAERIPEAYRDPDNQWFGLSLRARPIMYVEGEVDPAELSTYEDLADPKWQKQICIRSSSNIYNQSLVASLIEANGPEATESWAKGLVNNMARPPQGGDRDQIKAAAAGQCKLAVANTYYLAGMMNSTDVSEQEAASKIRVFWPNQADRGTHVNVSGAAITKAAQNRDNAIKLLEFLTSDEAQHWYAEVNGEYPVVADIESSELLQQWGNFKADDLNMSVLGENNADAVKLMDRAGWQ